MYEQFKLKMKWKLKVILTNESKMFAQFLLCVHLCCNLSLKLFSADNFLSLYNLTKNTFFDVFDTEIKQQADNILVNKTTMKLKFKIRKIAEMMLFSRHC